MRRGSKSRTLRLGLLGQRETRLVSTRNRALCLSPLSSHFVLYCILSAFLACNAMPSIEESTHTFTRMFFFSNIGQYSNPSRFHFWICLERMNVSHVLLITSTLS
ncbi:hypothetical protein MPTK1_6g15930 [Marchantia polymorpha subsp. ruderalis]|uniref:Uncharacterized protein n=2 Tax=Marchantia polymorpha TaxID=3197 RepID=A0AAF6BSJ0_MARPO|nr:hypothetical protein MARPO_0056s0105 [Marchantia polymorpha]BBN14974.1 hypothetical protein Mp_6g15930 [Marchantia polymorpha subsp. ruderalis]|eukprot:PTQ37658.1 hypothetical protein MARPO_0056s0105 [Marchantia polymorpha]